MAIKLVDEGLAKVRDNCQDQKQKDAQEAATAAKKAMWEGVIVAHVRSITWDMDNPCALVAKIEGKPIPAIVENVRDGSTVRVTPDQHRRSQAGPRAHRETRKGQS